MNPDRLQGLLSDAAEPAWDDEVRASSALYAGRQLVRTRQRRHAVVGSLGATVLVAGGLVAFLPHASSPTSDVVLGCAAGVGSSGAGLVAGGLGGVTLSVANPTRDLLTVTAGRSSVLALPGTTQVTIPISSGSTVRCGHGEPLRLTVKQPARSGDCSSVAHAADVRNGEVSDLTRAQLDGLPTGAVMDVSQSVAPLRRVEVRASGKVVAEALWHEMPGNSDWQLVSLSRCSY